MAKQSGSPAQIEAYANRLTEACIRACKTQGTIGKASAKVLLEGTYGFTKEGELVLDLNVGADIPDSVPVDADVGTEMDKKRTKRGQGSVVVEYRVVVKTKEGGERL